MIKIYYDTVSDELEILQPDGVVYWCWHDGVDNSAGWYRGKDSEPSCKNDSDRFIFIGEL